jgi:hypothetical protein
MDLKQYFTKLRELEESIPEQDVYLSSLVTVDGGKPGVITQAPRRTACQLLLEGRARLATPAEVEAFEEASRKERAALIEEELAGRIQVQVITDPDRKGPRQVRLVHE